MNYEGRGAYRVRGALSRTSERMDADSRKENRRLWRHGGIRDTAKRRSATNVRLGGRYAGPCNGASNTAGRSSRPSPMAPILNGADGK